MNNFLKDAVAIIKNYKWNSMFFRYFKALTLVIILPAIIFMLIILNFYISSTKSEIATTRRYDIIKSVIQFDKAYDTIDVIAGNIINSELTSRLINSGIDNELFSQYSEYLRKERHGLDYINSISVYNPKTRYVASSYGGNSIDTFRDISWLDIYNKGNADFSAPSSPRAIKNKGMINICRNLLIDDRTMGLIIFTLDGNILADTMYTGNIGENDSVLLFNENNEIIYSSSDIIMSNPEESISDTLRQTSYKNESVLKTGKYLYNFIASENYNFKLGSAVSMKAYNQNFYRIGYIMLLYFLITLVLVLIFSLIVAFTFYRSIVDVVIKTSAMHNDTGANSEEENDELMYLSDTLFNTIKNHQKIENELVEKIAKLKKVQSIALQTQINPHFLFNSLNLVNGFILEESQGESRAASMLSNISDILYIALNTKEYIVTVETELEYAKKYLAIEEVKYPGRFKTIYDIEPETLDLKTVKFVLQPIIENAIEHGIKKLSGKMGIIQVSASVMNNKLVLSVTDNGPKIPSDTLSLLEERLDQDEIQESRHIGLSNVNQRIRLIYGDEYGVSIYSDDEQTVVDIVMPAK